MATKNETYLIEYVTKLKQLNDINLEIPEAPIDEIIKDPRQYAMDFIESAFIANLPSFAKAYELGVEFGKKNK